jgi:hypothetical protein
LGSLDSLTTRTPIATAATSTATAAITHGRARRRARCLDLVVWSRAPPEVTNSPPRLGRAHRLGCRQSGLVQGIARCRVVLAAVHGTCRLVHGASFRFGSAGLIARALDRIGGAAPASRNAIGVSVLQIQVDVDAPGICSGSAELKSACHVPWSKPAVDGYLLSEGGTGIRTVPAWFVRYRCVAAVLTDAGVG